MIEITGFRIRRAFPEPPRGNPDLGERKDDSGCAEGKQKKRILVKNNRMYHLKVEFIKKISLILNSAMFR
jgi:hypothetical protein